tara:strand:+ start:4235 stop:4621 length:387 start_codon:yes stop_codon:yes gene_type:complete
MNNFIFSGGNKFYTFEGLLSSWIQTSITLLTTAMLFYHITRANSVKKYSVVAELITMVLLIISIVYLVTALINYIPRVKEIIKLCEKSDDCNDSYARDLRKTMYVYSGMVFLTIIVQIIVGYMVHNTI